MGSGNWLKRTKGLGKSNNKTPISGTKESYWCSIRIKSLKGGQDWSSGINTYVHGVNTSKGHRKVDRGSYKGEESIGAINKTSEWGEGSHRSRTNLESRRGYNRAKLDTERGDNLKDNGY